MIKLLTDDDEMDVTQNAKDILQLKDCLKCLSGAGDEKKTSQLSADGTSQLSADDLGGWNLKL